MSTKIFLRRGNKADLPVLSAGEPGFALDTKQLYMGTSGGNEEIYSPYDKKSGFRAVHSSAQTVTSGSFTKIIFGTENYDYLSEFDTTLGRFVAKAAGNYVVSVGITLSAPASGTDIAVTLYKGGTLLKTMQETRPSGTGNLSVGGGGLIVLLANEYIEIYVFAAAALQTIAGSNYSYFEVAKL